MIESRNESVHNGGGCYGGGYGGGFGGFGGIAPIGLLGLNSFLGGFGGGYGYGGGNKCCGKDDHHHDHYYHSGGCGHGNGFGLANNISLGEVKSELLQQAIATGQLFSTNVASLTGVIEHAEEGISGKLDALSGQAYAGFNALNSTVSNGFTSVLGEINDINTTLLQGKYEQALAMCGQTSTIVNAITTGFQGIKDQMCATKIADLERALAVAENGGPIVRPAVIQHFKPCCEDDRRRNNNDDAIAEIRQMVIQVGNAAATALQTANAVAAKTA